MTLCINSKIFLCLLLFFFLDDGRYLWNRDCAVQVRHFLDLKWTITGLFFIWSSCNWYIKLLSCVFSFSVFVFVFFVFFPDFPSEKLCCLSSGGLFHSICCFVTFTLSITLQDTPLFIQQWRFSNVHFFNQTNIWTFDTRSILFIGGYALKSMLYHRQVGKCTEVELFYLFFFVLFFCLCKFGYLTQKFRSFQNLHKEICKVCEMHITDCFLFFIF